MRNLTEHGTICIVSPSGAIDEDIAHTAIAQIEKHGFNVKVAEHVFGHKTSVFSSTDPDRASDLVNAVTDPTVDAIICARGGYGAVRTLQLIDESLFRNCNKWIVGFSDITAIHSMLSKHNVPSVHGPMLKHIAVHGFESPDVQMTFSILQGNLPTIELPAHPFNRLGTAEGRVTGGNLSLISTLRSTPADIIPEGTILFIEDLSEYNYHIDRMMQNLRYSGVLDKIAGLIVGQFTNMKDGATPFGDDAYGIINKICAKYSFPIIFNFPAGHDSKENYPLIFGMGAKIEVNEKKVTIRYQK